MKDKVILTDCDGVLLDWAYAFEQWMERHGYVTVDDTAHNYGMEKRYGLDRSDSKRLIRMFNESATIRKIPPLRDAIKYVKKLHEEHGYIFHCITSMSDDQFAQHLRTKNLIETFGPTVFERYIYLPCGADKDEVLTKYKGTECWWIEDKIINAEVGRDVGLRSMLMVHDHNRSYEGEGVEKVYSWRDIYERVLDISH